MVFNARVFFVLAGLICVSTAAAQQSTPPTRPGTDRIDLDVVVTAKSGPPIAGLQQQDFTVLDNKAPQTLTSFRAVAGSQVPIEVVLVIDDVNTGIERIAYERSEIGKFIKDGGGQLPYPATLAFLTDAGLEVQDQSSRDGNALNAAVDQHMVGLHTIRRSAGYYGAVERYQISLQALDQLAEREASRPGRKLIFWISPGWPLLSGPGVDQQMTPKQEQQIFADVIHLSTLLRQAHITVYSVDPLGAADFGGRAFYWQSFTKGISKPSQAQNGDLALQVIATQSGGLALTTSNDVAGELRRCMDDPQAYYELSFAPPVEARPDEYHQVEIRVDKHGLVARTRTGYYASVLTPQQ